MATFQDRLKTVIGPRGYETSMRRSLQSVVLYEAKRCIAPRLASLRPFQRKVAFVDQAHALVESLDFLLEHHKHEILWRTATSKEHLTQDLGWKRLKLIEKELSIVLATKAKEFCARGRSHEEVCDMIVQSLFVSSESVAVVCPLILVWCLTISHSLLYRNRSRATRTSRTHFIGSMPTTTA